MKDLYLKFSSEQEFLSILEQNNLLSEQPSEESQETVKYPIRFSHNHAMDIVGEISNKEGFHINLRVITDEFNIEPFLPYEVNVKSPIQIWS